MNEQTTSWICVDSGIVLKLVLDEPSSHLAEKLWKEWLEQGLRPIAPPLFTYELTAVLRKVVHRGRLNAKTGHRVLNQAFNFNVTLSTFPQIHQQAWQLATQLNRPTAYDAHYLALAQHLNCPFWTADRRLYNASRPQLAWVHWLGNLAKT